MRSRTAPLLFAIIGAWSAAAAPIPNARPVPAKMLSGRVLSSVDENFSLAAPSDGWHWAVLPAHPEASWLKAYVCSNETTGELLLVTIDVRNYERMTVEDARKLLEGETAQTEERGFTVSNAHVEPADFASLSRVFRITYDMTKAGQTWHSYAYAVSPSMLYQAACITPKETEPPELRDVFGTLHFLEPPAQARDYVAGRAVGALIVSVVVTVVGLAGIGALVMVIILAARRKRASPCP